MRPEVEGALKLANKHFELGFWVNWRGDRTLKNRKHAEKAQKLYRRALLLESRTGVRG